MNASPYSTDELVTLVQDADFIPINQSTFTDDKIISFMNRELQDTIVPLIQRTNEEFFVDSMDFTVDQNTAFLEIPPEATGMRMRDMCWMNSDGTFISLPRLTPEQLSGQTTLLGNFWWGGYNGYYLQGNQAKFYPINTLVGTIRMFYFRRPNILTNVSNCGSIVSIDTLLNQVTLDTAPDTSTWFAGVTLDAIHPTQPFAYADSEFDIVARAGLVFTFDADVIANLSVGDALASTGYSPFPQYIPIEAASLLVEGTGMRCLQALGDREGWKNAAQKYNQMEHDLLQMITPRVQGQPNKIMSQGGGIMTASRTRSFYPYF